MSQLKSNKNNKIKNQKVEKNKMGFEEYYKKVEKQNDNKRNNQSSMKQNVQQYKYPEAANQKSEMKLERNLSSLIL